MVNSVTYTDPTHVTLNVDTTGASAGAKDVTITNPDGQSRTGVGILTRHITASNPALTSAVSRLNHAGVGDFDVNMPLSGTSGVEDRLAGTYNIVLTFTNGPITSGNALYRLWSATGTAGSPTFSGGNTMTVPISGVVRRAKAGDPNGR